MSSAEAGEVCANCGKAAVDNIKLKLCTACKLVRYCSVECQKDHRPEHKKACKKRVAELKDDRLFTQPNGSHLGECPICCLPLPLDENKWSFNGCCCQRICKGCALANALREEEQGLEERCPYCREVLPETQEESRQNMVKRVKVNDPVALCQMSIWCDRGGDYVGEFEYLTKAANLGYIDAHFRLACMYHNGEVEKDIKKEVYHFEEAAVGGHPYARFNLGNHEGRKGRRDRAMKHFIIAAKLGYDRALEHLKMCFQRGVVSKEDYEAALRGHQAAVDATKSKQREEAYIYLNIGN